MTILLSLSPISGGQAQNISPSFFELILEIATEMRMSRFSYDRQRKDETAEAAYFLTIRKE